MNRIEEYNKKVREDSAYLAKVINEFFKHKPYKWTDKGIKNEAYEEYYNRIVSNESYVNLSEREKVLIEKMTPKYWQISKNRLYENEYGLRDIKDADYEVLRELDGLIDVLANMFAQAMVKSGSAKQYIKMSEVNGVSEKFQIYNFLKKSNVYVTLEQRSGESRFDGHYDDESKEVAVMLDLRGIQIALNQKDDSNSKIVKIVNYLTKPAVKSVFIHEIFHAYDDYVSEGKAMDSRYSGVEKRMRGYENNPGSDNLSDIQNQYLNLTHEIWARFAEHFTTHPPIVKKGTTFEMIPLSRYVESLDKFKGYSVLPEEYKAKLKQAITFYWGKFEQELPEINRRGYIGRT